MIDSISCSSNWKCILNVARTALWDTVLQTVCSRCILYFLANVVMWAFLGIINGIFCSVYILLTIFFKQQKAACHSKHSGKHKIYVPYSWAPLRPSGPDRSSHVFSSALPTEPPADSETPGSSCCPDAEPSPDCNPPGWKQEVWINIFTF